MLNKTALGEYFTGLVILTNSIPETLTDANGDNLRDCFMQTLRDAEAELDLGREVNWQAAGEPADVVPVNRQTLIQLNAAVDHLTEIVEVVPRGDHDE